MGIFSCCTGGGSKMEASPMPHRPDPTPLIATDDRAAVTEEAVPEVGILDRRDDTGKEDIEKKQAAADIGTTPARNGSRKDAGLDESFEKNITRIEMWVEEAKHQQLRSLALDPDEITNLDDVRVDNNNDAVAPPTEADRYPPIQR